MLIAIAVILIVLWLLGGFLTSFTVGASIHVLLVLAVISVLVRIIMGQEKI